MMKTILNIAILLSFSVVSFAQNPLRNFRDGNRQFREGNYNASEILFRRGLEADSTDVRGHFNLANTLYKQGDFEKPAEMYERLLHDRQLSKNQRANAFHNLGNSAVRTENYQEAVEAYKEAMKLNPHDDTRYNLAYALQKLQEQQQQEQNQDQQNDQNQNQDQQQQQQQQNQNNNQRDQQERSQPDQLRPGDAERMLNAMDRRERNTLDKRKENNAQQRSRAEKNW